MTARMIFVDGGDINYAKYFDEYGIRFYYEDLSGGGKMVVHVVDLGHAKEFGTDSFSVIHSLNAKGIYINLNSNCRLVAMLRMVDDGCESDTDSEGGCLCYDEDGDEINYSTWEDIPGLRG